ncbi:MAG: hypothetical protein KAT39_00365, partial [Alphaproteobacteria bacterium]|nr:hypothetical protein [Alphaproteobacteria bacterium]
MPFENAQYISELVDTNPLSNDPVNQGDDQIRQIKLALQANVLGDATETSLLVNNLAALLIERITEFPIMRMGGETLTEKLALGNVDGDDGV